MAAYLITYDLVQPTRNYPALKEYFSRYSTKSHRLESVYIVITDKSATALRNEICQIVDSDDKVLIVKLTNDWKTIGLPESSRNWLARNL